MKKATTGKHFKYPMCRFFKDDIIQIHETLTQNCSRVELTIEKFELESISELDIIPLYKASNLRLRGYDPYITFTLNNHSNELYISDDEDTALRGMKSKIEDIISQRKVKYRYLFSWPAILIIGFVIGNISRATFPPHNISDSIINIVLVTILVTYFYINWRKNLRSYSVVYLKGSIHDLSFIERNSDSLIVTTLGGLIVALFLFIIEHFFFK
ncbi:hypothetical protein DSECCO2_408920 [anaerobic digester metagenome]